MSVLRLSFFSPSVLVITLLPEPSLPAAGMVSTVRQGLRRNRFFNVEIPEVSFVGCAGRNGFCRVDGRTATHSQNEIDCFAAADFYAFIHFVIGGVGGDAAQLRVSQSGFVEAVFHSVQQAAFHCRAFAVDYQDLLAAVCLDEFSCLFFAAFAEYEFSGAIECEIVHDRKFFCYDKYTVFFFFLFMLPAYL